MTAPTRLRPARRFRLRLRLPVAWAVPRPAGAELAPLAGAAAAWVALVRWGPSLAATGPRDHGRALAHWTLMAAAMMLPLAVPLAATVSERTLRRRQVVAVTEALAAYLLVWVGFGAAAHLVLTDLAVPGLGGAGRRLTGPGLTDAQVARATAVVLLGGAAAWRFSAVFGRAVNRCHRVRPLAPSGPAADLGCVAIGSSAGLWCTAACWPVMAAMAVLPHAPPHPAGLSVPFGLPVPQGLLLTAVLAVLTLAERARRLPLRASAGLFLALAAVVAVGTGP